MISLDLHYVDPRLVTLYDFENPRGLDTDFYLHLAAELHAHRIIDLGCGTGLLARLLASAGHQVTGVDPSHAMLSFARHQPGAKLVQWIEGDATTLGNQQADLLTMTGNVAQIFLGDEEWAATLRGIFAALCPGGHLAFESRNPDDRGWERWTRGATYQEFDSPNGPMETWLELVNVANDRVRFLSHNVFTSTGVDVIAESELRFRSLAELTTSLTNAGFTVEQVYGDWNRGLLTQNSRVMVFVARRD